MKSKKQSIFERLSVILPVMAVVLIVAAMAAGCSGGSANNNDEYTDADINNMLTYASSLSQEDVEAFIVGEWARNTEDSFIFNADYSGAAKGIGGNGEPYTNMFTYKIVKSNDTYTISWTFIKNDSTVSQDLGINAENGTLLLRSEFQGTIYNKIYNRIS